MEWEGREGGGEREVDEGVERGGRETDTLVVVVVGVRYCYRMG